MTYGTTRGFTGHEHLDGVGLIHMNGRVYDPTIGRFLTPDPWIQDPKNPQSFNRYSYVWNNPLKYTDPTGEFIPLVVWGGIKLVSAGIALYGAYETGHAIGENINAVAQGEKTVGGAAQDAAVEVGTNVVLAATGLGVVKVVDKVAPRVTKQAVDAVNDKVNSIKDKDQNVANDLKSKPESTQMEAKADTDAPKSKHKNSDLAEGDFGVYEIKIDDELYKYGKADLTRITKSSGDPTRLHQQVRKLREENPDSTIEGKVLERGHLTTKEAKAAEKKKLMDFFEKYGRVPDGNKKSFKVTRDGNCSLTSRAGCGEFPAN